MAVRITFLESSNGLALSKHYDKNTGWTPYPHVKSVTSHEHDISIDKENSKIYFFTFE